MPQDDAPTSRSLLAGAAAGLAAGLLAAFAMDRFQATIGALLPSDGNGGEPATEQAADAIARRTTGAAVPKAEKAGAGQAFHYALGAALGAGYGVAAELSPAITTGFGAAFGTGVAALLDEGVVPAIGLGPAPWKTAASTHAYSAASHLVFGTVLEAGRRFLRRLA